MKQTTSTYDMDDIKYFRPDNAILVFNCPYCQDEISIDAGDGLIEYPEASQVIDWIRCTQCDQSISLQVNIKMTVTIDYEVVGQPTEHIRNEPGEGH